MKITLMIGEAEKTFHAPFVKGRVLRNFIKLQKEKNINDMDTETIDSTIELIVDAYNNQFSIDDFYDGIDARQIIPVIRKFIGEISGNHSGDIEKK